ncbi:Zeta toxin [Leishmania donovani]|uniref:Zeta_toxin_putative/Pfam:PF06414 n=1 Tax=Leishmania donovani TaxID=5661 RepID=A0A6J8F4X5_LEIDO|nr:Zeta toxin [Leishmania donovani]VDZ42473.1 Zeta_toxin_putative/Pfam:PF06414 [Leishmania donovani]
MATTASPQTGSSPTVPTPVAPPSIDEALSYWIGLSRLIHRVCVTSDSTPSADECVPSDRLQRCIGNAEGEPSTFTRYALHRVLLCCGIKQHRVRKTADHMLAQLLSAAYTTAAALTVPVVLLDNESPASTPFRSPVRQLPVPLPVLVADWLKQSSADDQNASQHNRYCLRVPAVTWSRSIIKWLGSELRGQMISLRPLSRWSMVCAQQSGRMPVVIFVGGASGAGKSTLASLVASQLRVPNVLSTDTVRQVLRTRLCGHEAQFPALFVSTYEAHKVTADDGHVSADNGSAVPHALSADENAIVQGYEAQCELVLRVLDGMLARLLARRESIVVEGVHLLPRYLAAKRAELLVSRVACVPVLVRIPKADSHLERLCIRARGMSMRAQNNRYIASFKAIRTIQAHLVDSVEAASLPVLVLSNTNMDKSFTALHHTLLETMEYAAVHGWPADAAAAAEVPLTGLVFTSVKDRLVAVVRQRQCRRSATDDKTNTSSRTGASAPGDEEKGGVATGPCGALVLAPHARLPAHSPAGSSSSSSNGAAPRARSAELLGVVQRCLLEQGLRYHSRTSNAQADAATVYGSSGVLGARDASSCFHAHVVVRRSFTIAAKSHIGLTASSHLPLADRNDELDEVEMPSLIGS